MTKPIMLLWTDLETTDLDQHVGLLFEAAWQITDADLTPLWAFDSLVDPRTEQVAAILGPMQMQNTWSDYVRLVRAEVIAPVVRDMHDTSGLWADLLHAQPEHRPTILEVESVVLHNMARFAAEGIEWRLAGSGVANFDVHWIRHLMPKLAARLHYRPVDVSVTRDTMHHVLGLPVLTESGPRPHRAKADLQSAIDELVRIRDIAHDLLGAKEYEQRMTTFEDV